MAYKAKTSPGKTDNQKLLDEALHRFKLSRETFSAQRRREAEDEAFAAGEQWDARTKQARAGNPNNGAANEDNLGAKPCLTISLLDQPMQQTINAFDDAEISVQFSADGGEANEATADVLNDLYRQIEAKSGANAARAWAFERGAKAGMGWYRVVTEYESDDSFDQCIRIKRVLNQSSIYPDPWAQEPDFSDGMFLFQTQDLPYSEFKKQYPDSKIDGIDSKEYSDPTDPVFGWIKTTETGERIIRVAEYFYVKKTEREVKQGKLVRNAYTRQLCWAKITAADVLEQQELDGKWIPYVPSIGKEHNLAGQRMWTGQVAPAKDAQRGYNVMWSELVSTVGISSKAPYIAAAGQVEDFIDEWQTANVRNWAVLRYKPVDVAGTNAPPPQRQTAEPPIQALTQACEMSRMNVMATMGTNQPALGNIDPQSRSGKAIVELKKQAEQGSGYVASFCSISVPCEARIILDLIPHVYDRKGRSLNLKSNAGKIRTVNLGQPMQGSDQPIDFAKGTYGVEVSVSKAFATRRQQAAEVMSQLIQAAPEFMLPTIGDLYFKNSDFAEHRALQERMEMRLAPEVLQGMKMQENIPPQARAQMTQMASMLSQTQAQLQQAAQVINTKAVENDAKIQIAKMDNQTKLQIAELQALVGLAATEQKVDAENARTMVEAEAEGISKKLELVKNMQELLAKHRADSEQQSHQQSHDAGIAAMQHHHDKAMAQMEHSHAKELADQAARHAQDQAVLAASIEPSPQADGSGD